MEFDGEADQRSKGWSAFCSTVIAVDLLKTSAIFGGAFLKYPNRISHNMNWQPLIP